MNVGIFGAGQAGLMVKRWLTGNDNLICFIDNNEKKQNDSLEGIPVYSLEKALTWSLDRIWIAILNKDAARAVEVQIRHTPFIGDIVRISDFRERQDIRMAALRLVMDEIKKREIPGAMAELGVYKGDLAREMNRFLPEKKLYLFDTFEGFDAKDIEIEKVYGNSKVQEMNFSDTSVELVRSRLEHPDQAIFCPGYFPDSLSQLEEVPQCALVSLDPDLYAPVYHGLKVFYPRLSPGGIILIHDYNSIQFPGVKKAVERYCNEENVYVVPLMDLHGSAVLIKQG